MEFKKLLDEQDAKEQDTRMTALDWFLGLFL